MIMDEIRFAFRPWMNLRLFVWTLVGLLVVLVGCFMASRSFSTADYLTIQLRTTLLEGETFINWKWQKSLDLTALLIEINEKLTFHVN